MAKNAGSKGGQKEPQAAPRPFRSEGSAELRQEGPGNEPPKHKFIYDPGRRWKKKKKTAGGACS